MSRSPLIRILRELVRKEELNKVAPSGGNNSCKDPEVTEQTVPLWNQSCSEGGARDGMEKKAEAGPRWTSFGLYPKGNVEP